MRYLDNPGAKSTPKPDPALSTFLESLDHLMQGSGGRGVGDTWTRSFPTALSPLSPVSWT